MEEDFWYDISDDELDTYDELYDPEDFDDFYSTYDGPEDD